MSFSIGIIGLPNAGKSTLFSALTKKEVAIAPYAFSTRQPNIAQVIVPDDRLKKISQITKVQKISPTTIEFVDVAGLVKNAHRGEGLGNQFLAHIRNCHGLIEVIRVFENPEVGHIEGNIDWQRDIEIIKTELLMKDLESLDKAINKLKKEAKAAQKLTKKLELLKEIREKVNRGSLILHLNLSEEQKETIKEFQFLTLKPILYLFNIGNEKVNIDHLTSAWQPSLFFNVKLEKEISELSPQELKELRVASSLDKLISWCYNLLELITFFTIAGGRVAKSWTLKKGATIIEGARLVHSDFAEKFIKAEVINWQKLIEAGGWSSAREQGWLRLVGKDYIVQDGDIIEFKI